jgi:TRAP-type C4-dicarboxylate transport system permease small subunit
MTKLLHRLLAGAEWLAVRAGHIASAALLIMTVGVTLDVLARFVLGAGTKMAIEMSGYALVAIVFLGLAYTHKTNGHIEIDFLIKRLSARAQRWCRIFNSIVFLAYTVLLGYFGWKSFWTSFQFNTTSRTGLDVLIWPYQLVIPVGLLIASLLLVTSICFQIARGIRHATDDSAEAAS